MSIVASLLDSLLECFDVLCILFIPSNLSLTPVDTQIDLELPK